MGRNGNAKYIFEAVITSEIKAIDPDLRQILNLQLSKFSKSMESLPLRLLVAILSLNEFQESQTTIDSKFLLPYQT